MLKFWPGQLLKTKIAFFFFFSEGPLRKPPPPFLVISVAYRVLEAWYIVVCRFDGLTVPNYNISNDSDNNTGICELTRVHEG